MGLFHIIARFVTKNLSDYLFRRNTKEFTSEEQYECEHCEKQFSNNIALEKKHEKRHLTVSSNEQFQYLLVLPKSS